MSGNLFERVLGEATAEAAFSSAALIAAMLRFEVELAQAQARAGVIPAASAAAIARHAATFAIDAEALLADGRTAGSLAIPFVKALTAHVADGDGAAADHVHFGSTSQDVLDTALVLCTREAVALLLGAMEQATRAAVALARRHADTPMLARTLMQPAGVTTFGFKAAQWAVSLSHAGRLVRRSAVDGLALSFGGAVGDLAAQRGAGAAVRADLAEHLGLRDPGATWHTRRETWLGLATDTALVAGVMGKIAGDIALLAQAEVGEASEAAVAGRGGSTAMPHKRNPVLALRVIAAVHGIPGMVASLLAAMPQEHERALGSWQAELAQWPAVFVHAVSAATALSELLAGLSVHPDRCRANIESTGGRVFAERLVECFAPVLGKREAQAVVADLCDRSVREGTHLHDLAAACVRDDARLAGTASAIDDAFDIGKAALASAALVEATLGVVRAGSTAED